MGMSLAVADRRELPGSASTSSRTAGVVRSDLWREMSEEDRSAMYDSISEALPVGRVGEVSDIAETFLYLMRNGYSSGTMVTVDGGSVLV
jgi:NAD(P)-dependent dehydrogenase (short-subunit alcohol dehydrogenase family)